MTRESRSSSFGFSRFVFWNGLNKVFPVGLATYFVQQKSWHGLRRLLSGYLFALPVYLFLFWLEPVLALAPLATALLGSVYYYAFVGAWHSLYSPGSTSRATVSGGDYTHAFHHRKPNVHLDDWDAIKRSFDQDEDQGDNLLFKLPVPNFWRIQGLFWSRDFDTLGRYLVARTDFVATNESLDAAFKAPAVTCAAVDPARVREAVLSTCVPHFSKLDGLDDRVSKVLGRALLMVFRPPSERPASRGEGSERIAVDVGTS